MFTTPATGPRNTERHAGHGPGRHASAGARRRVRGPARVLRRAAGRCASPRRSRRRATGQIRALVTVAGNPVVSTPNARPARRARSPRSTSWSASTSTVNETTRHADVILPPEPDRWRGRTTTSRSTARDPQRRELLAAGRRARAGEVPEWQIHAAARRRSSAARAPTPTSTRSTISSSAAGATAVARRGSNVEGRDADELLAALATARGPERVLDFMLRTGPVRRRLRRRPRRPVARRSCSSEPARRRPRPARSRACPRCCARRRG